jgi:hypothetical protein
MTTTRKLLPALLLLLASWTGQALADQAPPAQTVEISVTGQDTQNAEDRIPEVRVQLAWQRVGSPIGMEA